MRVGMLASFAASTLAMSVSSPSKFWTLRGRALPRVADGESIDLGEALLDGPGTKLLVLGTYPADFNMIEYLQQLNHYYPALKKSGVSKIMCAVNGKADSCKKLAALYIFGLQRRVDILFCWNFGGRLRNSGSVWRLSRLW